MRTPIVTIDDDTAVAPFHVVKLRVGRDVHPQAWGLFVTFVTGETWFRPAEEDTQQSARNLLAAWRRTINEGI